MKKQTNNTGNRRLLKKIMKSQAKRLHLTPEPPVMAQKEINVIQTLVKLVNELRDYIEYVEMAQSGKDDHIYLDFDAIARKVGMGSRKELKEFLDARAG